MKRAVFSGIMVLLLLCFLPHSALPRPIQASSSLATSNEYVIVTFQDFFKSSALLNALIDFAKFKAKHGFKIIVLRHIGGGNADDLRNLLKSNFNDGKVRYLLLIGDPAENDAGKVIPMKQVKPFETFLTDHYYADLNGDWDSDGNDDAGELTDDVEFENIQFLVGRIPFSDEETIVNILNETIDFESSSYDWKKNVVLISGTIERAGDSALVQNFNNFLLEREGLSATTLFDADQVVVDEGMVKELNPDLLINEEEDVVRYLNEGGGVVRYLNHPVVTDEGTVIELNPDLLIDDGEDVVHYLNHPKEHVETPGDYAMVLNISHGTPEGFYMNNGTRPLIPYLTSDDIAKLNSPPPIFGSTSCSSIDPLNPAKSMGHQVMKYGRVAFMGATATTFPGEDNVAGATAEILFPTKFFIEDKDMGVSMYETKLSHKKFRDEAVGEEKSQFQQNLLSIAFFGDPSLTMALNEKDRYKINLKPPPIVSNNIKVKPIQTFLTGDISFFPYLDNLNPVRDSLNPDPAVPICFDALALRGDNYSVDVSPIDITTFSLEVNSNYIVEPNFYIPVITNGVAQEGYNVDISAIEDDYSKGYQVCFYQEMGFLYNTEVGVKVGCSNKHGERVDEKYFFWIGEQIPPEIVLSSFSIDDDSEGESMGDGDGIPEPKEMIEIELTLQNIGNENLSPREIHVALSTTDEFVTLVRSELDLTATEEDKNLFRSDTPYLVSVSEQVSFNHQVTFNLAMTVGDQYHFQDSFTFTLNPLDLDTPLIIDEGDQISVNIDGDTVVWVDRVPGIDSDTFTVYAYNLATQQKVQITTTGGSWLYFCPPAIDGNKIVWTDNRNGNDDIYLYDLETGIETQITNDATSQFGPNIDQDKIVWMGENHDVYMYDLTTQQESLIATNGWAPVIDGNKIVWVGSEDSNIYMYDLLTHQGRQITTSGSVWWEFYSPPSLDNGKIVWVDGRNDESAGDIYMYDLSTDQEIPIVTEISQRLSPAIDGDKIVWVEYRNGNYDIYLYDLTTRQESQITTNTSNQLFPSIDGNKIVWIDDRNEEWDIEERDIYMATLPE